MNRQPLREVSLTDCLRPRNTKPRMPNRCSEFRDLDPFCHQGTAVSGPHGHSLLPGSVGIGKRF